MFSCNLGSLGSLLDSFFELSELVVFFTESLVIFSVGVLSLIDLSECVDFPEFAEFEDIIR